jgi:putative glutamine amidotransferase
MQPLIGITGRRISASLLANMDARYAARTVDSFFSDYARGVAAAGGIPVHLPFEAGTPAAIERLDALVVTGGQDVHPDNWGGDPGVVTDADPRLHTMAHDVERDDYEVTLVRAAVALGVPVLGVCRGHQILNVSFGGTLIADLPPGTVEHYLPDAAPTDGRDDHVVRFAAGSLAAAIYGPHARVNSWHHQSVDTCGTGLLAGGHTTDGVVESIEMPGRPVLGLQWHPEWQAGTDPAFSWLVDAARSRFESARSVLDGTRR